MQEVMSANGEVHTFYSSTPAAYNSLFQTWPDPHKGVHIYWRNKRKVQNQRLESKMGVSHILNKPSGGDKEMNPKYEVVTVQLEGNVINTPLDEPLPDHLGYSIFTMLCCCLPLGIAALVYSITTQNANLFGHRQMAEKNSRMARKLNNVSLGIGISILLLVIGLFMYVGITFTRIRFL